MPKSCPILSTIKPQNLLSFVREQISEGAHLRFRKMRKIHKIAGLKISRVESKQETSDPLEDFWTPKDSLPDLEPPEEDIIKTTRQILASNSIPLSHRSEMEDVFERDSSENRTFTARATVYVMNLIVIVMALPIGLGLLFFNILFGANLRTTAHVIALTGMGIALAQTPGGENFLGFL